MRPRLKKVVVITLKLAILAGVVEYARRQSQLGDEIAVVSKQPVAIPTLDGPLTLFRPGARLNVLSETDDVRAFPTSFRVALDGGALAEIPAGDVEGTHAARPGAPFSLLPGMRTMLRRLDLSKLWLGFLLFGPALFLMAVRWQVLLVAAGVRVPFWTLVRLHYLGFFFNTFMPGGAGGDIVKAVYVTRHSARKAEAATMVVTDRVIGLLGLLTLAGGIIIADYGELSGIAAQVGVIALAAIASFVLFFSERFRRLIRFESLLRRLPRHELLERIDASIYGLRRQKGRLVSALALTLGLQLLEIVGVSFAGRAIGIERAGFRHYLAFVPIGYLFNALPLSFGGIGLMEGAYLKLFRDAGLATATQGFTLGVVARLIVVGWSLLGAVSAIFPPERALGPAEGDEQTLPAANER